MSRDCFNWNLIKLCFLSFFFRSVIGLETIKIINNCSRDLLVYLFHDLLIFIKMVFLSLEPKLHWYLVTFLFAKPTYVIRFLQ